MKKILFVFFCCISFLLSVGQIKTVGELRYDTVKIWKSGGTAELRIINQTNGVKGYLYNKGNGITEFRRPLQLNDSTLVFGIDTFSVGTGGGGTVSASVPIKKVGSDIQLDYSADGFAVKTGRIFNKAPVLKSVSEIRALPSADLDTGFTYRTMINKRVRDYYYVPGDLTTPDDSVINIRTAAGALLRMYTDGIVYVRDFGATIASVNNLDDDAIAFNRCFRWVKKQGNNVYKVMFDEGQYKVKTTTYLPDSSSALVQGHTFLYIEGNGTSILTDSAIDIFQRKPQPTEDNTVVQNYYMESYAVQIKGINFYGQLNLPGVTAIHLDGTYSASIKDCHFFFLDTAISMRFALNATIQNNYFQGIKSVCIFGGSGIWTGATVCNSGYNAATISKNRFNNYTGSFAAVMLANPIQCIIEDNISEGNHPQNHIWISGKASACQTTNEIRKLWVESGGGSVTRSTVVYSEARNNLYISDVDINGTDFTILDCQNDDITLTHRYIFDKIRSSGIDTAFRVNGLAGNSSFEFRNLSTDSYYAYLYTPATWAGLIPYHVAVEKALDAANNIDLRGSSIDMRIATGQRGGITANGSLYIHSKLMADEDNGYQWGGINGSVNYRPNVFFMGTYGAVVDNTGKYRFGDALNLADVALSRDSIGQISITDNGSNYKNVKAQRFISVGRSSYTSAFSLPSMGNNDLITKGQIVPYVDSSINAAIIAAGAADGSETKVTGAGVTGAGTIVSPYVISSNGAILTTIAALTANASPSTTFPYYITDLGKEGNVFYSSTESRTADNAVVFQAANGNKYVRVPGDVINFFLFGALADGTTDNRTAFLAAFNFCKANNKTLLIPSTPLPFLVNITLDHFYDMAAGQKFRMVGEGARLSGFKAMNNTISLTNGFNQMFIFRIPTGIAAEAVEIKDIGFDGNRTLNQAAIDSPLHKYDGSGVIKFACVGTGTLKSVRVENCYFTDPISSNVYIGPSSSSMPGIKNAFVKNCYFENHNGVFADIIYGSTVNDIDITDCVGISNGIREARIESEFSSFNAAARVTANITNCRFATLEVGSGSQLVSKTNVTNSTFTKSLLLSLTTATLNNVLGKIQIGSTSWTRSNINYHSGTILLAYDGTQIARLIPNWSAGVDMKWFFDDVTFEVDTTLATLVGTDAIVDLPPINPTTENIFARFTNCTFDPRAYISIDAGGFPQLTSINNKLGGTNSGIYAYGHSTLHYPCKLISQNDRMFGTGKLYKWGFSELTGGGLLTATLSGSYDSSILQPLSFVDGGIWETTANIVSDRKFFYTTAPGTIGGLKGDLIILKSPLPPAPFEYIATVNSLTAATWVSTDKFPTITGAHTTGSLASSTTTVPSEKVVKDAIDAIAISGGNVLSALTGASYGMTPDWVSAGSPGTDDAPGFVNMTTAAAVGQLCIVIHGDFYFASDVTLNTNWNIKILGNIHFAVGKGFILNGILQHFECQGTIWGAGTNGVWSSYTGTGIKVGNAYNNYVYAKEIRGFKNAVQAGGIAPSGSVQGAQYNTIEGFQFRFNETQILLTTEGNPSGNGNWSNSNTFIVQQLGSGLSPGSGGTWGVKSVRGSGVVQQGDPFNNNKFYVGLEGLTTGIELNFAQGNSFYDPRFEPNALTNWIIINAADGSKGNQFFGSKMNVDKLNQFGNDNSYYGTMYLFDNGYIIGAYAVGNGSNRIKTIGPTWNANIAADLALAKNSHVDAFFSNGTAKTVTAAYTLEQGAETISLNAASGNLPVTLPNPSSNAQFRYREVTVKLVNASSTGSVIGAADGSPLTTLTSNGSSLTFRSNASLWWLVSSAGSIANPLAIANGGTGAQTQVTARNNILAPNGGNAGMVMKSNGTTADWANDYSGYSWAELTTTSAFVFPIVTITIPANTKGVIEYYLMADQTGTSNTWQKHVEQYYEKGATTLTLKGSQNVISSYLADYSPANSVDITSNNYVVTVGSESALQTNLWNIYYRIKYVFTAL